MNPIHVDFETRSRADLRKIGAWAYAEHPSTEIILAVFHSPQRRVLWVNPAFIEHMHGRTIDGGHELIEDATPFLTEHLRDLRAWNAEFEIAIWEKLCGPRHGWPVPDRSQWTDTMALAAAAGLPMGLGKCAEVLGTAAQKDNSGHNLMMQMCKPRKPSKNNPAEWWMDSDRLRRLALYCKDDVEAEAAIHRHLPPLTETEKRVWQVHLATNARGIYADNDYAIALDEHIAAETKAVKTYCTKNTEFRGSDLTRTKFLKEFLAARGVETESLDKEHLRDLLRTDIPEDIKTILECRRKVALTSTKKIASIRQRRCLDGRIRGTLAYWGAGPGRWAGRGIQPQNFARGMKLDAEQLHDTVMGVAPGDLGLLYDSPLDAMTTSVRGVLAAPPGKQLLAADYSAIEARLVFWFANDFAGLKMYKDFDAGVGPEPYVIAASNLYGLSIEEIDKVMRGVGKQQILGSGYGMGAAKFDDTCWKYDIDLGDLSAKDIVSDYRRRYCEVPKTWWRLEAAAIKSLLTKKRIQVGKGVSFYPARLRNPDRVVFYCQLPSGRRIAYPYPSVKMHDPGWGEKETFFYWHIDGMTKKWQQTNMYGGKWMENIIQAIARDFMAEAFLRCDTAGIYPTVLTVHDEILSEIEEGAPDSTLDDFCNLLCVMPDWAKLDPPPIQAAGWRGLRYRKD